MRSISAYDENDQTEKSTKRKLKIYIVDDASGIRGVLYVWFILYKHYTEPTGLLCPSFSTSSFVGFTFAINNIL